MTEATIVDIQDIEKEPRVEAYGQRWDYVTVVYSDRTSDRRYFHVDCDCITGDDARCVMCHKPSPVAIV